MTSSEVASARLELELSTSEFAEALGVPESRVAEWESGKARLPRGDARILSWLVALRRREKAIKAARLPECEWATQWLKREDEDEVDDAELSREMDEWDLHVAGCATCRAREDYINTHLGPQPSYPESRTGAVFTAIERRLDAVPAWTHPALLGVAVAFATVAWTWGGEVIWWLMGQSDQPPRPIGDGLRFVVVLTAITGALGLVYGGVKELFRRVFGRKSAS